jgi:acetoin utilization protein AcuC
LRLFLGSEIYRHSSYGPKHPLSIPRVSATMDLARAMGWLSDADYRDSIPADMAQLARFHDRDYIDAVQAAERDGRIAPDPAQRFNLGKLENPVFPEMFRRPAMSAGAAIQAAALLADGGPGGLVFSPASGTHHARAGRASGFCYFNAPVLGILELLERGLQRVLYVDLDAHHGDGVQDAFHDDDRVLTISIHDETRWPRTGKVTDRAGGMARNLPVPPGFNDTELRFLLDEVVLPLGRDFCPEALVVQCGADGLADDPLSGLCLSNRALWDAVAALVPLAPRILIVGGGGYNPWSVSRCWAGLWAQLRGHDPLQPITAEAEAVLRALSWNHRHGRQPPTHWFSTIADTRNDGRIRPELFLLARAALAE